MSGKRTEETPTVADRGQAYTLEGFAAAAVVLFAMLFAMQSGVVTPGSGGAIDRTSQAQERQELQDGLVVAANADAGTGNLSEFVRYWADAGYVDEDDFEEYFVLGSILEGYFADPGPDDRYGVEFVYLNETETEPETAGIIGSRTTDPSAVTASYRVTLYDHDEMTEIDESTGRIEEINPDGEIHRGEIPPAGVSTGPVYNVVEVRVTVW